jgi:ATP-binding cassette subfamily B protein
VQRFGEESRKYRDNSIHLANLNAWFSPVIISLIGLSSILTVFVGGQQVMAGKISTGNIAEFLIYVNMLTWPVTSLGWVISMAQRAAVSQNRINEFLDVKPDLESTENADHPVEGELEFRGVSLRYPETGIQAVNNISFRVRPGESLGILGGTGSGKSSLANLVCRLFDPDEGEILLDGRSLKSWNIQNLRKQIGYVPQDVFLFSDSIANNILFGEELKDTQAMEKAALQADLSENISRFEKGFETVIGERGITLSGGQKQRVSIARALVRKPRILVLDDCLSAVDTATEKNILGHLKEEMKGRTTLIISHRISSVNMADTILVMEEGKIVQSGKHEALMSEPGPYRNLFEKQLISEEAS